MADLRSALLGALSADSTVRGSSEAVLSSVRLQVSLVKQLPAFFSDSDPTVRKLSAVFYKNCILSEWNLYSEESEFFIDNLLFVVMQCDCDIVVEVERVLDYLFTVVPVNSFSKVFQHAGMLLRSSNEREYAAGIIFFKRVMYSDVFLKNSDVFERFIGPHFNSLFCLLSNVLIGRQFLYARLLVSIFEKVLERFDKKRVDDAGAKDGIVSNSVSFFEQLLCLVHDVLNIRILSDRCVTSSVKCVKGDVISVLGPTIAKEISEGDIVMNDNITNSLNASNSNFNNSYTSSVNSGFDNSFNNQTATSNDGEVTVFWEAQPQNFDYLGPYASEFSSNSNISCPNTTFVDPSSVYPRYVYVRSSKLTGADQLHLLQSKAANFLLGAVKQATKRRPGIVGQYVGRDGVITAVYACLRSLVGWHCVLLANELSVSVSASSRPRDRLVSACISVISSICDSKVFRRYVTSDSRFLTLCVCLPLLRFGVSDFNFLVSDSNKFIRDRYSLYAVDARSHAALLFADIRRRLHGSDSKQLTADIHAVFSVNIDSNNFGSGSFNEHRNNIEPGFNEGPNSYIQNEKTRTGSINKHFYKYSRANSIASKSATLFGLLHMLSASPKTADNLVMRLQKALESDAPFLRAQVCFCLQYADNAPIESLMNQNGQRMITQNTMQSNSDFQSPDNTNLLRGVYWMAERILAETETSHPSFRVDALVSTAFFYPLPFVKPLFEKNAAALIKKLLEIQTTCEVEAIGSTLEDLIGHFPEAASSCSTQLTAQLCQLMQKTLGNGDDEMIHTHQAYLRTIQTLLFAFHCQQPSKKSKLALNDENTQINGSLNSSNEFAEITAIEPLIVGGRYSVESISKARALTSAVSPLYVPIVHAILSRRLEDLYDEALQLASETIFCMRAVSDELWALIKMALRLPKDDRALVASDLSYALDNALSFSTKSAIQCNFQELQAFYAECLQNSDTYGDYEQDIAIGILGMQTLIIHSSNIQKIKEIVQLTYTNQIDPEGLASIYMNNFLQLCLTLNCTHTLNVLGMGKNIQHFIDQMEDKVITNSRCYDLIQTILSVLFLTTNKLEIKHTLAIPNNFNGHMNAYNHNNTFTHNQINNENITPSFCLTEQEKHFLEIYALIENSSTQKGIFDGYSIQNASGNYEQVLMENAGKLGKILFYAIEKLPAALNKRKKIKNNEDYEYEDDIIEEDPNEETYIDYINTTEIIKKAIGNLNNLGKKMIESIGQQKLKILNRL